jgi:hypothetical protein
MMTVKAGSEATETLCDKFTKADGKRGKPAKGSKCAVCETVIHEHFNIKRAPERKQFPVLHPEMVRVIETVTALPPRPVINPDATGPYCDKFTMPKRKDGKRAGKPALASLCSVCETPWVYHFSEKKAERGEMRPVLHPEMVRVIPEPKRRRPRAVVAAAVRKVANTVADFIDPETTEVEPEVEPIIDRMLCGHPITELQDVDGEESCVRCVRVEALWVYMRNWSIEKEMKRTGKTREEATVEYDRDCEDW